MSYKNEFIDFMIESDVLKLNFPKLETGVHKIRLTYLIKNAGTFFKKSAQISLSLTDMGWNLPTDSLTGVVLFPVKIQKADITFLLGKNRQEIKGAFDVERDVSGAVFFRATHLMPAHSSLQLALNLTFDAFVKNGLWNKLISSGSFLIFIISLGIILLYLILNIIEIKITPIEEVFMKKKYSFSENLFKNFLYRTGEMWIGLILLWGGAFFTLYIMKSSFSALEFQFLFLIPVVFIFIIDYLLLYPRQERAKQIWRKDD